MTEASHQLRLLLTGPALCGLLLAGMTVDNRHYRNEADFADFHRRAAAAIGRIPRAIGPWVGEDQTLSRDELALLQPNAYRYIVFTDTRPPTGDEPSRKAILLVTQCKRAGLMEGHYPPICYPARGYAQADGPGNARSWTAGNRTISGMEYFFTRRAGGQIGRMAVYNFMVLPEQGVRPDMESVNASAEDYQQRYYGAAQFQLVFVDGLASADPEARTARDQAFAELIGPCSNVIATLSDGVNEHE